MSRILQTGATCYRSKIQHYGTNLLLPGRGVRDSIDEWTSVGRLLLKSNRRHGYQERAREGMTWADRSILEDVDGYISWES